VNRAERRTPGRSRTRTPPVRRKSSDRASAADWRLLEPCWMCQRVSPACSCPASSAACSTLRAQSSSPPPPAPPARLASHAVTALWSRARRAATASARREACVSAAERWAEEVEVPLAASASTRSSRSWGEVSAAGRQPPWGHAPAPPAPPAAGAGRWQTGTAWQGGKRTSPPRTLTGEPRTREYL
jgi:hypothetical protein